MTGSPLLLLAVLLGLLLAGRLLLSAIAAIWAVVSELLAAMLADLRALAVIVVLIACVVVVALAGGPPSGPGVG